MSKFCFEFELWKKEYYKYFEKTFYEQLWLSRGLNIKYIRFEPQPRDALVEPDVEIERDNYTSKVEKIR